MIPLATISVIGGSSTQILTISHYMLLCVYTYICVYCVCTCIHVCVCVCMFVHMHACVFIRMCAHACVCVCVGACSCMDTINMCVLLYFVHVCFVCGWINVHVCVQVCVRVCVCVCVCVHAMYSIDLYIYVNIHKAIIQSINVSVTNL